MVEALHEAELPKGLLNVVTGLGNIVGAELARNPDVAKISFTGSVGVGRDMRDGAATMKRVTLELGGKSPTILLDDADLDKAIPAALIMAFLNSGQACAAGTRLLVPRSRLEAVKRAFVEAMRAFTVGDPADPKTALGRWCRRSSTNAVILHPQRHRRRCRGPRRGRGSSGRSRSGLLRKAHGIRECEERHGDRPRRDFRPVLCVIAYDAEETRYGSPTTPDMVSTPPSSGPILRARRVASQIRAGRVVINGMTDDPQAPWGGFKYSGVGREYGGYGIEAFLETRAILEASNS